MRTATIDDIKSELKHLSQKEILSLTLRLARFKKENKELLTYLLFESHDEQGYLQLLKTDISEQLAAVEPSPLSKARKSYRKVLRGINRQIKYIGSKAASVELLLHYCAAMRDIQSPLHPTLETIVQQQLVKIEKWIPLVEEDLQFEFKRQSEELRAGTNAPILLQKKLFRFRRSFTK
ncbi:MAG: hypothetical protein JNK79_01750 [Chitinophagaceae bacterium]|nr:hypothetical protein [Chitinophagaceae bacterium]